MSGSTALSTGMARMSKFRPSSYGNPAISSNHVFEIPAKLIKTPADMKIWEKSEAYFEYLGFILAINEAIKGKSNSQGSENLSECVIKMVGVLDKLDALIDETPPVQQPQRFGNVAFRTWYQKMKDESLNLLEEVVKPGLNKAIPEIVTYLIEGFGNSTRIDYGTGHEISFIMFLCCLFKIGIFGDADKVATGCYIFPRYLDLARKLQKTYRMEPAGSHGVWSLDDYQFVPFIWGSSQLVAHPIIEPHLFLNQQILNDYGEDFMFLTCIQYINSVKTGPFAEHSNQLWSVSGVSSWTKINGGLIKMYKAEVLSKFPVVQHIVFGSLFTLKPIEQCSGMMTPKYEMAPPPNPAPATPSTTSSDSMSSFTTDGGSSESSARSSQRPSPGSSVSASEPSIASSQSSRSKDSRRSDRRAPKGGQASKGSSQASKGSVPSSINSAESDVISDITFEAVKFPRGSIAPSEREGTESVRFSEVDEVEHQHHGRRAIRMPLEGKLPFGK